jgi:transcriptional regulator with XRE-family HTH domain
VEIGTFLRDRRVETGLTQVDLATRSGLSQAMVSAVEAGRRRPSLDVVERLLAGLGLQLRLDVEPLAADLDEALDESLGMPPDQRLDRPGLAGSALLTKLAPLRPVVEGLAGAALHGVPVPVSRLDVVVAEVAVGVLTEVLLHKMFAERWTERWKEWIYGEPDWPWPAVSRWRTIDGEFRLRVAERPPDRVTVVVEGTPVAVRPLHQIEGDDTETRRVLARVRQRDGGRRPAAR